jgi:hypothetical protein
MFLLTLTFRKIFFFSFLIINNYTTNMAYQDDLNQPSGFYTSHIGEIKRIWYSRGAGPRFEELYTKVTREARHHSKWREFTEDRKLWVIDGAMWIHLNGGNDSSWTVPAPDENWYAFTATWKTGVNAPAVPLLGASAQPPVLFQSPVEFANRGALLQSGGHVNPTAIGQSGVPRRSRATAGHGNQVSAFSQDVVLGVFIAWVIISSLLMGYLVLKVQK